MMEFIYCCFTYIASGLPKKQKDELFEDFTTSREAPKNVARCDYIDLEIGAKDRNNIHIVPIDMKPQVYTADKTKSRSRSCINMTELCNPEKITPKHRPPIQVVSLRSHDDDQLFLTEEDFGQFVYFDPFLNRWCDIVASRL